MKRKILVADYEPNVGISLEYLLTRKAKGLALGADAYMTKPFSTREMVQKVADILGAMS